MRSPAPFILLLVLLVSGCSTTDDSSNSSESRKEASLASSIRDSVETASNPYTWPGQRVAPEPTRIQPAFNRMTRRTYRVPVQAGQDKIEKATAIKTLASDLGLVAQGDLELSEVAKAFEGFAYNYAGALEQTVGYYERLGSALGVQQVKFSSAYESAVKLWMAFSGGAYDQASFERCALSLLKGYRLDLQISDPATAGKNLLQGVEKYLW